MNKRLVAEWEKQDGILIAWPSEKTDWRDIISEVEETYLQLVKTISDYEKVLILTEEEERLNLLLKDRNANLRNISFFNVGYNDTWARDFGPITLKKDDGFEILDFNFNGWGLKFPANLDNQITKRLFQMNLFKNATLKTLNFVLEGGSIETNGNGILLTTENCLLSANRNPDFKKEDIENRLQKYLNVKEIIWIKHGYLVGDDTDSHIDTLIRFAGEKTILYVLPPKDKNDVHYEEMKKMEDEVLGLKCRFNIKPLPFAPAIFDEKGNRLPATYANFLIINDAVILPVYNERESDTLAIEVMKETFPDREIITIDSTSLIRQHGSIHCITMQFPEGVLNI